MEINNMDIWSTFYIFGSAIHQDKGWSKCKIFFESTFAPSIIDVIPSKVTSCRLSSHSHPEWSRVSCRSSRWSSRRSCTSSRTSRWWRRSRRCFWHQPRPSPARRAPAASGSCFHMALPRHHAAPLRSPSARCPNPERRGKRAAPPSWGDMGPPSPPQ